MTQKCWAHHSGIENKSWLHCFQIPPPKNSSRASVGKIWMLRMLHTQDKRVSCMKSPLESCRKLYYCLFLREWFHKRPSTTQDDLMNHINSAAWGQTGRLLNTYALFDFKLWSKNLLKVYGFTVETTLFCGFLNLWVILTTTIQPLSSLINIYMRETWENQWQDMLSSDTHGILRYSYSLLISTTFHSASLELVY